MKSRDTISVQASDFLNLALNSKKSGIHIRRIIH
jgi:hypothetical protein